MDAVDHPLITTFGRLVEAYTALERDLGGELERSSGIPHSWFEVMLRIARTPDGLTMGDLAGQIALTTGGVTRLIDRMITAGFVERTPCPTDRRITFASLTPAGRAKLDAAAELHARNLEAAFAGYSPADVRALDDLLGRLGRQIKSGG